MTQGTGFDPELPPGMVVVYRLAADLQNNPEHVSLVQRLTLDAARPHMGLKGVYGLFGSEAWWEAVHAGVVPTETVEGVIERAYFAGQDSPGPPNSCDVRTPEGVKMVGIYTNDEDDAALFTVGKHVKMAYLLEPLKCPNPDTHSRVAYWVAIEAASHDRP